MTPEAARFLDKAKTQLTQAEIILGAGLPDAAGRAAYLAGFHAAQALIFERCGKILKTHSGVQSEFARLVKDEPAIDPPLRGFLGRAYNLKAIADYETGPGAEITAAQAGDAITTAKRFVATLAVMLGEGVD